MKKKMVLLAVILIMAVSCAGFILIQDNPSFLSVQGKNNPSEHWIDATIPGDPFPLNLLGGANGITIHAIAPDTPASFPLYNGTLLEGDTIFLILGDPMSAKNNVTSPEDAPAVAEQVMESYGGLPPDAIFSFANTSYLKHIDGDTGTVLGEWPTNTEVAYHRHLLGMPIVGQCDMIIIDLGENGEPLDIYKIWRTLEYTGSNISVITPQQATEKFLDGESFNHLLTNEGITITNISLGFYEKSKSEPQIYLEPVWIFSGNTTSGFKVGFQVYARQFANFTATPTTGTATQSVTFTDTSDASPTRWFWDFGDGTNATAQNSTHVYNVSGTYNVTLKVWNDLGSDTISRQYSVNDLPATTTATPTPTPAPPELYPNSKWLTENTTVFADNSYYATIHGVEFYGNSFFAIIGNGLYNITDPAYTWTEASAYPSGGIRYTLQQLKVYNCTPLGSDNCTDYWYPPTVRDSNWQWVITDGLGEDAYQTSYGGNSDAGLLENGLGASTNHCDGTYYLWYGNVTAAYTTRWGRTDWLVPTYENATYLVNLTEIWTDTPEC